MDNMDAFNGFHLCEIIDCKLNRDNICSVNANFDNANCKQYRVLPENPIRKNYDGLFHKKDCIALDLQSSSKGAQRKWLSGDKKFLIKEQFYYQLRYWNDDLVEVIASSIGKQLHINCMEQWLGNISGQDCSFSYYWGDKKFIPFGRLEHYRGIEEISDVVDKIKYTVELLNDNTHLDFTQYLADMTVLDFLVGNEDRHLFNFGALYNGMDYEVPALFDFGLGLFEHDVYYKSLTFEQCLAKMSKKPFHDWDKALNYFAAIAVLPEATEVKISKKLLPNLLAEPYLVYSFKQLGIGVCLCD